MKRISLLAFFVCALLVAKAQIQKPTFIGGDTIHCSIGDSSFLEVFSDGAISYQWYIQPDSSLPEVAIPLATNSTYSTGPLPTTMVYYVEANDATTTSERLKITVNIAANIDVVLVDPMATTICDGDSVTLTASSELGGSTIYKWFVSQDAPVWIASGPVFHTGPLHNDTTFFVEGFNDFGCGTDVRVPAAIVEDVMTDIVTVDPNNSTVCKSDSVTMVASTESDSIVAYCWYKAARGGSVIATGDTFNTGAILETTTYYVSGKNSRGCETSVRGVAQVILNPNLDVVTSEQVEGGEEGCLPDSFVYAANSSTGSSEIFRWYKEQTDTDPLFEGDTFTTPILSSSQTYYLAGVDSNGCETTQKSPLSAVVLPNNDLAFGSPPVVTFCGLDSFEFAGISSGGLQEFRWYNAASQGNLLSRDSIFRTGAINTTNVYFVATVDSNGCESARNSVEAVKTFNPDLTDIDVVVDESFQLCLGADVKFTARTAMGASTDFHWYFTEDGLYPFAMGDTIDVTLDSTITVYVEGVDSTGCSSPNRTMASVAPILATPVTNAQVLPSATICFGETAQFSAETQEGDIVWFADPDGVNMLHEGSIYFSNDVQRDLTVYAASKNSEGCLSALVPITVMVDKGLVPIQYMPGAGNTEYCIGSDVRLSVNEPTAGGTFAWYASETATTPLLQGTIFNIQNIQGNRSLYIEHKTDNGCISTDRTHVEVTVLASTLGQAQINAPLQACEGDTVELSASHNETSNLAWFDAIDGNLLENGATYSIVMTPGEQTYFVNAAANNTCLPSWTPVVITGIERPLASEISIEGVDDAVCLGSDISIIANFPSTVAYQWQGEDVVSAASIDNNVIEFTNIQSAITVGLSVINAAGCASQIKDVAVALLAEPTELTLDQSYVSCNNKPVVINFGESVNYYENGILLDQRSSVLIENVDEVFEFEIASVSVDACVGAKYPIQVVAEAANVIDSTIGDLATCIGGLLQIDVSDIQLGVDYFWYNDLVGQNEFHVGDAYETPELTSDEVYYIETRSLNCRSEERYVVNIKVDSFLTIPSIVGPTLHCIHDTLQLVAEHELTDLVYSWYLSSDLESIIAEGKSIDVPSFSENDTIVLWIENAAGCVAEAPVEFVTELVSELIPPIVDGVSEVCAGEIVRLKAFAGRSEANFKWLKNSRQGEVVSASEEYEFESDQAVSLFVVNSIGNCVSDATRFDVFVNSLSLIDAPGISCDDSAADNTVRFNWTPVANAKGYQISNDGGFTWELPTNGMTTTSQTYFGLEDGDEVSMMVRAISGDSLFCFEPFGFASVDRTCRSSDAAVNPTNGGNQNPFDFPKAFSPNGDGQNDHWDLACFEPNSGNSGTVKLFDRWGMLVFESTNYNNMDNRFEGHGLDEGAYFYHIEMDETGEVFSGYVMLLK